MTALARSAPREPRRSFSSWAGGLSCGFALMLTPATILVLAAALVPSIVVRILAGESDRGVVRAVLVWNIMAMLAPTARLWRTGPPTFDQGLGLLAEPRVLCGAWLAGLGAWTGTELLAVLANRTLMLRDHRKIKRLDREIEALREEWGSEAPAGGD